MASRTRCFTLRNALLIDENLVVTTDNSGGIGEKAEDLVSVSDQLTAYYAARVTLLEQWAANAEPVAILLHNFSGQASWNKYVQGVKDLFQDGGVPCPPISGSTETNMELVQSAIAVTIIGKQKMKGTEAGKWFTYGQPLVGAEVIENAQEVACIQRLREARDAGLVNRIWPVGSQGILHELRQVMQDNRLQVESELDIEKSAGPSTVVLVKIPSSEVVEAKKKFGSLLREIEIR